MTRKNSEYPLSNSIDVETLNGRSLEELTVENVLRGEVDDEDVQISDNILEEQAEIAEQNGQEQLKKSLRRAAELTRVPDERINEIYNRLRPSQADEETLRETAMELREKYDADRNAAFIEEAIESYKANGLIKPLGGSK